MTPCNKFQESLAAEALDADVEVEAHLASCPACRAEAEAFRRLAASFRGLESRDPGELFFASQRKRIHQAIAAQAPSRRAPLWRPALALAAAVVLLFIGFTRWQGREGAPTLAWSTAMLGFVQGQGSVTGAGILELEALSPDQLESLAHHMERRIFSNQRDELLEESPDLLELSGPELDQLIRRLRNGEQA